MVNNQELNPELMRKMFNSIRSVEIKNIKTQKRDDKGMVGILEKYIDGKVREEMKDNEN